MEERKEAGAEAKQPKRKSRRLAEMKEGATDVPDEEAAGKTNNHRIILSSCKLCLNQQPLSAIRSSNDDLDFRHPSLNKSGGGAMEEFGQESNLAAAEAAASKKKPGPKKREKGCGD